MAQLDESVMDVVAMVPQAIGGYLSEIKQGDVVYIALQNGDLDRGKVSRVTATQVILKSGGRYSKSSGSLVGASNWSTSIILPTVEVRQRWSMQALSRWGQRALPSMFAALPQAQQMDIYRQIKNLAGGRHVSQIE